MATRPSRKPENSRLSSLAQPRDLNLSASKPKKVYAPNINAVRNKGKAMPAVNIENSRRNQRKSNKDSKKSSFDKTDRYIQSTGIFSEGAGDIKKHASSHGEASEAHDVTYTMEKPTVDTSATWNIDEKHEAQVISHLLAETKVNIVEEDMDYQPITLPLSGNKEHFFKRFAPKTEDSKANIAQMTSATTDEPNDNFSFSSDNNGLVLIQLPDSMPGRGYDEEGKVIDYTLDQMMEGQIGKIIKRKSGKVEIMIGSTSYTLDRFAASAFTEEVVCVPDPNVDSKTTPPALVNLGAVTEKYVVAPSWHQLLNKGGESGISDNK